MQKSNIKNQNDKEKFKKEFFDRLVKFSVDILKFSEQLKTNRLFWSISDQLIRSSTSVGANVVEARSAHSKKDYIKFFEIALKSANETKYWLIVIKESNFVKGEGTDKLTNEIDELAKILGSSLLTLKGRK